MQTIIDVVNNVVTVTNENKPFINRTYSYSEAQALDAKVLTKSLLRLSSTNPKAIKENYLKAGNILGVSVAKYILMVRGAAKRAYIDPINPLIKRFCLTHVPTVKNRRMTLKWKINPYRVDLVNSAVNNIQEYINDGNENIAAYAMIIGNAKEAKIVLGKKLWKKICKTSKSRNDLIWSIIIEQIPVNDNCMNSDKRFMSTSEIMSTSKIRKMVKYYHDIPTTLLNKMKRIDLKNSFDVSYSYNIEKVIPKIIKYIGGPMCKINNDEINTYLNLVIDTTRMRNGFNPKWSIKRMIKEHENGIRDQMARSYSKDIYDSVKYFTKSYRHKGCVAELITSSFDLAMHGKEQHHCVGSYANEASIGNVVVYKITDINGNISTLGVFNPNSKNYKFMKFQHYMSYNKEVTDKDTLTLAEIIKTYVLDTMKEHPEINNKTSKETPAQVLDPPQVLDFELYPNDIPF